MDSCPGGRHFGGDGLDVDEDAVEEHLKHRRERNGEEDAEDPIQCAEGKDGYEAHERADADGLNHQARHQDIVLHYLENCGEADHPEHLGHAERYGHENGGQCGKHRPDERNCFEEPRQDPENERWGARSPRTQPRMRHQSRASRSRG